MSEPIKIEVKYANKDIWHSYFQQMFRHPNLFYSFFGFIIFAFTLILSFYSSEKTNLLKILGFTLFFTIFWQSVLTYLYAKSSLGSIFQTYTFIFSEENFDYSNAEYKTQIEWKYIEIFNEKSERFDVTLRNRQNIWIPIREVEPKILVEIRELVRQKLGDKAKLKN